MMISVASCLLLVIDCRRLTFVTMYLEIVTFFFGQQNIDNNNKRQHLSYRTVQ